MLYIIAAASGTGKTSLTLALAQTMSSIKISISHTTRSIRVGETPDKHYFFVSEYEFLELVRQGVFFEHAKVFGHYYGTSRHIVEKELCQGNDVILDIDWQGARQIKKQIECRSIFLLPPSYNELKLRLEKRKRDDLQIIEERLQIARSEVSHLKEFDYIVINDKFEDALLNLQSIVRTERLLLKNQLVRHSKLIEELIV